MTVSRLLGPRQFCRLVTLFALLGGGGKPLPARADNWPGWRGPSGMGTTAETGLPVRWTGTENVRWKIPLSGVGAGSPVVWGERVFLTASDGRQNDRLHVYCFHRAD